MPRSRWPWAVGAAFAALGLLLPTVPARADQAPVAGTHVVQAGETLSQIADDAAVDAAALAALNGLDDPNLLSIGQTLKLPVTSPAGAAATAGPSRATQTYTVADGDTLWGIAQQFGSTPDALVQINALDDANALSVGTVLTVPVTVSAPTSAAQPAHTDAAPANRSVMTSYTVQPGETLGQIARQLGVGATSIAQANNLDDPNKIGVGAVLKVPLPAKQHTVSSGETLRDIALAEKVDLGSLIDFNQLDDPALIRVGQVLLLPVAATAPAAAGAGAGAAAPTAAPPSGSTPSTKPATPTPAAAVPSLSAAAATVPTPKPSATPTPKPTRPLVVAAPPAGAPSDGLAGAGLKLLGDAYVWGGSSPSGFDCSGFIWYVSRQIGKPLSRGLLGQFNSGSHPAREELKPGDLVFFQNTYTPGLSHNGIYIGNNQFVHAADEQAGVTISSLNTAYWSSHWFGATRLP